MSEEDIIAKYEPVVASAIYANYYRVLGQSSLPFNINEMIKFVEAETRGYGKFGGTMKWIQDGTVFKAVRWEDVTVGEDVTFNMIVWGFNAGKNTVFSRVGFWRMYILELATMPLRMMLRRE